MMMRERLRMGVFYWLPAAGFVLACGWGFAGTDSAQAGTAESAQKAQPKIEFKAYPFDLKDVRLLDGPFKDAMERDRRYLHELDSNRLLHNFRINAGIPSTAQPLGGWEEPKCEVRGHSVGHYLSACALMFAACGDEALKAKADAIVAELSKCQAQLKDGYLSAFPEEFFDRLEAFKPVWAPYYTYHKIMAGLLDMKAHCGNEQALRVVQGMAAWVKKRTDRLDEKHMQRVLDEEFGGMSEVLTNLYGMTGDPAYLELARRFNHKVFFDPLAQHQDRLKGRHVNTNVPKVIGAAREYEMTGEKPFYEIATYFWDAVTETRCFATGGTGNYEYWRTEPNHLAEELGVNAMETCCQYNMLKLTRHLFEWNPDPKYADYYERTLYNSILESQSPENGMTAYYTALNPGHWKVFCTPNDSFWCCTGTGMENHAKYGDSIYFHDNDGVFVNLFIASELRWKDKGIGIRQETHFPQEDRTALVIQTDAPVEMALRIRIPNWVTGGSTLKINGEKQIVEAKPSSYVTLKRAWKNGDRVEATFPMSLRLQPLPDDAKMVAILYGPLVLAGELGTEKLTKEMQYLKNQSQYNEEPGIEVPRLKVETNDINDWLKPLKDRPLAFRTVNAGIPKEITFIPLCELFGQRFAVYWPIRTETEWKAIDDERRAAAAKEEARERDMQARMLDRVEIGHSDSEREHRMKAEKSGHGTFKGKAWRDASGEGWFSYELKTLPDQPMRLLCRYWGEDVNRAFQIWVDDVKIAEMTLDRNQPGKFFDMEYEIPPEPTRGKERVTVKFTSLTGKIVGGVFDCAILKAK